MGRPPPPTTAESFQSTRVVLVWTGVRYTGSETAMGIAQDPLRNGILSVATDRHIVELLVRMRMGVRRKRRDFGFYERLGKTKKPHRITPVATTLATLLPPRNDWPRPAAKTRQAASIRGKDATAQLLVKWILSRWGTPRTESPDWLMELRRFSGRIRHRLATWDASAELASPETFIKLKTFAKEKGEADEYRGLAVYSVEDRLVVSLAARYWRLRTDDLMHSGSVAFRTAVPPKTHHSAVSEILAFRRSLMKLGLDEIWVSEVDIRGFFDVISIVAARRAVEKLAARLPPELKPDIRAVGILNAFLESYSFNKVGQPQAIELAKHKKRVGFGIAVPWPEAQLKALGVDTSTESVGIPQGGALSCFLANAVLDQADQAVQAVVTAAGQDQHALYLRYCDDIICLATSEGLCRGMMEAYKRAVESLRLPIHPILEFKTRYVDDAESKNKKTFWDGKSKAPYRWGPAGQVQWVPWCSFVGYQIRHDGYLRVRPKAWPARITPLAIVPPATSTISRAARRLARSTPRGSIPRSNR